MAISDIVEDAIISTLQFCMVGEYEIDIDDCIAYYDAYIDKYVGLREALNKAYARIDKEQREPAMK